MDLADEATTALRNKHPTPGARRSLQGTTTGAIGCLAGVVAELIHSGRLDLAAQLIGLIGYLTLIYGSLEKDT